MGSDNEEEMLNYFLTISIHAPVWGATVVTLAFLKSNLISIHAPVWGATFIVYTSKFIFKYFNSRSRVGSDYIYIYNLRADGNFNSRSRVGSDCTLVRIFTMIFIFLTYIINLK